MFPYNKILKVLKSKNWLDVSETYTQKYFFICQISEGVLGVTSVYM